MFNSNASSADAGGANYIEDVFSTYLYNGGSPPKTITNGIDLAGEGGLTWIKSRNLAESHRLVDTVRGATKALYSNATDAQVTEAAGLTAFTSSGFTVDYDSGYCGNTSTDTYASWTFRKQPKFFDIVTYTGNSSTRTISHSLASAPGMIIIKRTTDAADWWVWQRTFSANEYVMLNSTAAKASGANSFISSDSTGFTIGSESNINGSGNSYVAYLFAHNAGGFGLTGTDNVISCGSFTTDGSGNASVNLGYEPQWLLVKGSSDITNWLMADNMRGWSETNIQRLFADTSNADSNYTANPGQSPTATGFKFTAGLLSNSTTYIYIAIRRGPMKVPTSGTSVFSPNVATTQILTNTVLPSAGFPVDLMFFRKKDDAYSSYWNSRLLPDSNLQANDTAAEITGYPYSFASMTAVQKITNNWYNGSAVPFIFWQLRRAPSFFDEVCYTGDGAIPRTITHNLTVAPELIITKARSSASFDWMVGCNFGASNYQIVYLNATNAATTTTYGNYTGPYAIKPTSTTYGITGDSNAVNQSGTTYVAYLFATCAGVSKVGSYTGTATTQQINCGFTSGARFVLIKRTDSAGDWYVWDSARGIVAGNDPYLLLNSTAAEVTGTDYVDTYSAGFELTSTAPAAINASGGTFLFLAIA